MNDLRDLMRENVAAPPHDDLDLPALVGAGRRRVRRRRTARAGGIAAVVAGAVIGTAAFAGIGMGPSRTEAIDRLPSIDAPTLRVDDADEAVEGRDYRVVASYTNDNLERDNGRYFDGVTDDGLILFRDGPTMHQEFPRYALMDPATGDKDWLPDPDTTGRTLDAPVELGSDRLVIPGLDSGARPTLFAYVFDRNERQWSILQWPGLPKVATSDDLPRAVMGPDDRLYVLLANQSDHDGDTYDLWSASLSDHSDVRDEGLNVGDLAFTETSMVWTDSTNDDAGLVHVRDLQTGEERSFDPQNGEKCNLLDFAANDDWVVMGQYCGTYADGVRDDRVQVLTTDGDQVVTIQDTGIDGGLDGANSDVVTLTSADGDRTGTYVYDISTGRFLRVSDSLSSWGAENDIAGGSDQFVWFTPEGRNGSTQSIGELTD